jgi:GNAT superfamily N-acetyltransferase
MDAVPQTLITTYLEMTRLDAFRPASVDFTNLRIDTMTIPDAEFYRFLYRSVGEKWRWRDRLELSDAELGAILKAPGHSIEVLYIDAVPAGYIELAHDDHNTEIVYFGLRPAFFGRGLGKHLLSHGVSRAWRDGAWRVWVHTCNLDGPHALKNYLARGFTIYDVKEEPMPPHYL